MSKKLSRNAAFWQTGNESKIEIYWKAKSTAITSETQRALCTKALTDVRAAVLDKRGYLRQQKTGLWVDRRSAQDRARWRQVSKTVTLQQNLLNDDDEKK